jgi:hypothetical protein|tara:strand:+ start:1081 stop:1413 length:333 start_codon:yes stop_codon:yes gene_type:complete
MSNKEDFYKFSDNTKVIYNMLNISLFIIIFIFINPFNIGNRVVYISKIIIILILTFILTTNYNETINFTKKFPNLFSDLDYIDIKNNILLSHGLTGIILCLIFYIISTFF